MDILNSAVITDVINFFTVSSPKGRHEKIVNRKSYALSFCIEGQITYTHNGKKFVSDKNHAVILPQGQTYELYGDKKGIFPVINFKCRDHLCSTIMLLPLRNAETYIKDFEKMKALSLFENNRAQIMSIFYGVIHRLSCDNTPVPQILTPAIEYLEKNYCSSDLSNKMLADECNISEIYFRKLFTQHFCLTPKQYIMDIRIDKAKSLLADGILKINAISSECGFSTQYHFCRTFKAREGMTPTQYMKQNKTNRI